MTLTVFAIVDREGIPKKRRGGKGNLMVYTTERSAKNHARTDGDSVVECEISLDKRPLFIRGLKLIPEG